jgi:peptidoglycan/LPS O-acetylase OafA/YrhL
MSGEASSPSGDDPPATGYTAFLRERYFPSLDGLRCVSVLLVLTIHSHVEPLKVLKGYSGVTIFFVISGFLITTLLLREEASRGRADLIGFYIRRVFRLLPLYLLALLLFTVGVYLGLGQNPGDYAHRLLLFLTFGNEFASPGTFGHSWSLSVEEKFYFLWPLIAFLLPVGRRFRLWVGVGLLVVACAVGAVFNSSIIDGPGYFGVYAPIIAGCVLALLANGARTYPRLESLATKTVGPLLVALAIAVILLTPEGVTDAFTGIAVALAFPYLLLRPSVGRRALSARWMVWAGRRAYAVYLFHPLVGSAVDAVLPQPNLALQIVQLILMTVGTFALAELLHRLVEQPLIRVGRRISDRRRRGEPRGSSSAPIQEPG